MDEILVSIGFLSYFFAFVAFSVFTTLMLFSWRRRSMGTLIILASFLSMLWSGIVLVAELGLPLSVEVMQLSELARSLSWCLFLLAVVDRKSGKKVGSSSLFKRSMTLILALLAVATLCTLPIFAGVLNKFDASIKDILPVVWVAIAIAGMALVEQVFRNSDENQRWATKFLCLGIGSIFAYDFFMYADALLLKRISLSLWEARGFVNGMAVPMIAISVARNPNYELDIHLSHRVVFHTASLMGAGIYLLVMAAAGYFIRFYGGNWGSVLQVVFFVGAGVLLLALMFSDKIRATIRVLLSKHFFPYKYDYREQWQEFTRNLAGQDGAVPERVIGAIASLVNSPGGALWEKSEAGRYALLDRMHMPEPGMDVQSLDSLISFVERTKWVIDLDEYLRSPEKYQGLSLSDGVLSIPNAWLVVPLAFKESCIGFVLLRKTELPIVMNWEDWDLLKMAGQQAAIHLAQYQANRALLRSQQFEAFNRLSAYVVHDLKNILAQQSLIVANAEKHKQNPEFIEDVLATIKNSVARMTRLMEQMRSGERGGGVKEFELSGLLKRVVEAANGRIPAPELKLFGAEINVTADGDQLATVFGHIVQNAQDATGNAGSVFVRVFPKDEGCVVVEVEDTGVGMSESFIKDRLFKPFDSTKGLTGMGVGAFESREYIRALGGDILVKSEQGKGSLFTIILPYNGLESNRIHESGVVREVSEGFE